MLYLPGMLHFRNTTRISSLQEFPQILPIQNRSHSCFPYKNPAASSIVPLQWLSDFPPF